jgi:hypothetical protein
MKKLVRTILVILALFSFVTSKAQEDSAVVKQKPKFIRDTLFTIHTAERILGQSAFLSQREWSNKPNNRVYLSGYSAFQKDKDRTGTVYFLIEQFNDDISAHQHYINTKIANAKNGIKTLRDLGNEGYFHTDNENFYFIMARKGNKVFNIKVNKITSHTSLADFNEVAREIAGAI